MISSWPQSTCIRPSYFKLVECATQLPLVRMRCSRAHLSRTGIWRQLRYWPPMQRESAQTSRSTHRVDHWLTRGKLRGKRSAGFPQWVERTVWSKLAHALFIYMRFHCLRVHFCCQVLVSSRLRFGGSVWWLFAMMLGNAVVDKEPCWRSALPPKRARVITPVLYRNNITYVHLFPTNSFVERGANWGGGCVRRV